MEEDKKSYENVDNAFRNIDGKSNLWTIVGKLSSFLCAFVIIKWFNFEAWWYLGDGSFSMNRLT